MTTPDHDEKTPFRELSVTFAGSVEVLSRTSDQIRVRMRCPACRGSTEDDIVYGVAGTKGGTTTLPLSGEQPFICACGYPHDGRPPEALDTGCGAYWSATVPS
ncbi:hypothetical protein O7635_24650 [Asanoa sp. WMMD1127]|uniref:hypothetical protein n=1 Tax=Asanoa sp. WMMD1127 TaxID=3016107 RepID=UPI002415E8E2|nr:hypothetical protein [Asanoa sp. WMMD1127]MDG4825051.1 hypothetical protein [Asanoa sp. WMMD1127]